MKKNDRNEMIDTFKGCCTLFVIIGHSIQFGSGLEYLENSLFFENNIFKFIYSFHMPVFMLISGFLFWNTIYRYSFKENLYKRFSSLILPLVVWCCLDGILYLGFNIQNISELDVINLAKKFIFNFLLNRWFLWAIFYCSLVVLIVSKIFKSQILRILIYILGFVITFFIPDVFATALYKFMYPFYIVGFMFAEYKTIVLKLFTVKVSRVMIIVSGVIFAFLLTLYNYNSYIYTSGYYIFKDETILQQLTTDIYRFVIGLIGSIFCLLLMRLFYIKFQSNSIIIYLNKLGSNSLGIYIISGYLHDPLLTLVTKNIIGFNYILVLLETLIICFLSYIFTILIGQCEVGKRYLLGNK